MFRWRLLSSLAAIFVAAFGFAAEQEQRPVRIGISNSLFDDLDEDTVQKQMQPFADNVKMQTGVDGRFGMVKGLDGMVKAFQEGAIQMAVMPGIEYGWLKAHCKDVKPLLIAVIDKPTLKAVFLVARDSPAKQAADLKGQTLALAKKSPPFTRFYLERLVAGDPAKYFQTVLCDSVADAIESVVEGKAAAALVSESAVNVYKAQKPGRFNRLRILEESPDFPAAVLVYRTEADRAAERQKFRDALLKAHETPEGRQTLTLWRLSSFQEVPKDYEGVVDAIVKKYPPPKP